MELLLLALGAIGHAVLWMMLINRVHGLGVKRHWVNLATVVCVLAMALIPIAILAALFLQFDPHASTSVVAARVAWGYLAGCAVVCIGAAVQRLLWRFHPERADALRSNHTTHVRLPGANESLTAPGWPTWMIKLPANQALRLRTQEKELVIPRLPAEHDGLRIAHLTDLHMSGRVKRAYYEHVVEEVNAAAPDIVAITGDIVEGDRFLDWLPPTLGRLRAKHGVYYVLGNHDRHATESRLKAVLAEIGLIHVGGSWRQLILNDAPLVIAGNELPWCKSDPDLSACPSDSAAGRATRLLLAHSPDQFRWAQENDVDLMLAGHLHGGQVCFPLIGPIASPSLHGVRYVSGVFSGGNAIMHVSRGAGSLTPIRINCPPEIALLILRSK